MKKVVWSIIVAVLIVTALIYWGFSKGSYFAFNDNDKTYHISEKWELSKELNEISGISNIGNNELACIQDKKGVIYIYNLETSEVTDRIPFGEAGDYEAISVAGETAWVARSDGKLFEIINYRKANKKINSYKISGIDLNDLEAIEVDTQNNSLLLMVKEYNTRRDKKGIYAFNLATKTINTNSLFELDVNAEEFKELRGGRSSQIIRATALRIHPKTGEIYILEGHQPKIIILNQSGVITNIHILNPKTFPKPEGLAFDEAGNLYISNESRRQPATILQINLDD